MGFPGKERKRRGTLGSDYSRETLKSDIQYRAGATEPCGRTQISGKKVI